MDSVRGRSKQISGMKECPVFNARMKGAACV